jgi:prepilin-type N-terminal cleavage/methylation domain-containing protein
MLIPHTHANECSRPEQARCGIADLFSGWQHRESMACVWVIRGSRSARAHRGSVVGRRGFTLLELMLVLAIIAAIGAIAFPAFHGVLDRQRLQASAEKIRLELDRARLLAMKTGQAQMFECAPGQGKFSVHPLTQQSDITNAAEGAKVLTQFGTVAETAENGLLLATDQSALSGDVKELEEKITFVSCVVATDSRAYTLAQQSMSGQVSTTNVGQIIVFYPDGSTSNAEVRLQNERGEVRAVRLRGLTGHVKILTITNVSSAEGDET